MRELRLIKQFDQEVARWGECARVDASHEVGKPGKRPSLNELVRLTPALADRKRTLCRQKLETEAGQRRLRLRDATEPNGPADLENEFKQYWKC